MRSTRLRIFPLPLLHQGTSLLLAIVYFCFQVEVFEEEYEKNCPMPNGELAFNYSSENWESFDKDDVQQPSTFSTPAIIAPTPDVTDVEDVLPIARTPYTDIHCNSPPVIA